MREFIIEIIFYTQLILQRVILLFANIYGDVDLYMFCRILERKINENRKLRYAILHADRRLRQLKRLQKMFK